MTHNARKDSATGCSLGNTWLCAAALLTVLLAPPARAIGGDPAAAPTSRPATDDAKRKPAARSPKAEAGKPASKAKQKRPVAAPLSLEPSAVPLPGTAGGAPRAGAAATAAPAPTPESPPPSDQLTEAKEHYRRGSAHFQLAEYQQAAAEFRDAFRLRSEPGILFNLAQSMRLAGNPKDAAFFYGRFLSLRPGAPNREAIEATIAEMDRALAATAATAAMSPTAQAQAPAPLPAPAAKVPALQAALGAVDLDEIGGFGELDPAALQGATLCVGPVVLEQRRAFANNASNGSREATVRRTSDKAQKLLLDAVKGSAALKNALAVNAEPMCGWSDQACSAAQARAKGCSALILAGTLPEEGGVLFRARLVDANAGRPIARAERVWPAEDDRALAGWAQGLLCRAVKGNCAATLQLDADRPELRLVLDDRPQDRSGAGAGVGEGDRLTLPAGLYRARASSGDRTSLEQPLVLLRGDHEIAYARQSADGGLSLTLRSTLVGGPPPGPSAELASGKASWTRTLAWGLVGAGILSLGGGGYEHLHATSLVDDANAGLDASGGVLRSSDADKLSSAKTATTTSRVLLGTGIALAALGAVMMFTF